MVAAAASSVAQTASASTPVVVAYRVHSFIATSSSPANDSKLATLEAKLAETQAQLANIVSPKMGVDLTWLSIII